MPRIRTALLALALLPGLAACDFEQVIDLPVPPYQPRLVLGGFPTPDSVFVVHVGRSLSVLEPRDPSRPPDEVAGATVVLRAEDGTILDSLRYVPRHTGGWPGWPAVTGSEYRSARGLRAEAGRTYEIEVSAPGLPTARATTTLPEPVPVSASHPGHVPIPPYNRWVPRVEVTVADPPGRRVYVLTVTEQHLLPGGEPHRRAVMFSSPEPLFRDGFDTLDEAVGFDVGGRTPERRVYDGAVYFRNAGFAGGTRTFAMDVLGGEPFVVYRGAEGQAREIEVSLHTLSHDYARYQQTLALQRRNEGNPFAEPVRLHSNVEGGHGVFAGYSTHSVTVRVR